MVYDIAAYINLVRALMLSARAENMRLVSKARADPGQTPAFQIIITGRQRESLDLDSISAISYSR